MKAFFPIVGEKEYKDTTLRTKRRQCVFTKLRIESVFISFVSFSFNKHHVSVPTRTSIRVRSVCQINSCYPRYYLPTVSGPTANLVFKTSRESIEIHHWSIPHCGQPQQFNIQHSKLNIALRASVCKKIFVTFALLPPYGQWAYGESRVQNISWEHRNSSLVNSTLRPAATIQHSTFKTQHCAPRLRVQKNIRVIRFIRVQNNSCSKSAERDLCAINIRLILL